ncbi:MAG: rod shape-determining protein MreD [Deltaproteobacteria bacterium]|nr:rod shape-determining protein MreD [Deltaproteobacteria bacterium]
MRGLVYVMLGLCGLWLQVTLAGSLAVGGIRPNLMLLLLLVVGLRWQDPWVFLFGALVGLAMDSFSHGILGLYAISYLLSSVFARATGQAINEQNVALNFLLVLMLSLTEGMISLGIFDYLNDSVPWWSWFFTRVIPGALYTALLSPVAFPLVIFLERSLKLSTPELE